MRIIGAVSVGLVLAVVGCGGSDDSKNPGASGSGGNSGSSGSGGGSGSSGNGGSGGGTGGSGGTSGSGGTAGGTQGGLLQAESLTYLGSFSLPGNIHSGGQADAGFEYGATALGYNPTNDSLFMAGHDWDQFVGEVKIPSLGGTGELLQPLVDVTEGKLSTINPGDTNAKKIGGLLPWGDQLIVSAYAFYDAGGTQELSHFVRPIDTSKKGELEGPLSAGPLGAGFYSGYMGMIPPAWQEKLQGPALTGQAGIPIVSRTSFGPGVFSFDPDDIGSAKPLVYYPEAHKTLGDWAGANEFYSGADSFVGIAFPEGSASVLFIGRHGATFCYGIGVDDPSLDGVDDQCYDPDNSYKGTHGYPYNVQVTAYDANELAKVVAGEKQPWDVKPYAAWSLPDVGTNAAGATYDPKTQRLFVSEPHGDGDLPLIHVYQVSVD